MGKPGIEWTSFLSSIGLDIPQKKKFLVLDPPIMALVIDLVYVNEKERGEKIEFMNKKQIELLARLKIKEYIKNGCNEKQIIEALDELLTIRMGV